MMVKKTILEIFRSGIIPVLVGGYFLFDSNLFWRLLGLGEIVVGVIIGLSYIKKASQDTSEKRTDEQ